MKSLYNKIFIFIVLFLFETISVNAATMNDINVGDYISYKATSENYEISSSLTYYASNQSINPSELDLWRVIKINDDDSIEIVSVNVSSATVHIKGFYGYVYYVNILNQIAKQYINTNYASDARILGYSNQAGRLNDVYNYRGDEGYTDDINAVNDAFGTLVATTNDGTEATYWLGSRHYVYYDAYPKDTWHGRVIWTDGTLSKAKLYEFGTYDNNEFDAWNSIRPVVVLKSDSQIKTGDGTQNNPYQLMKINTSVNGNGKIEYEVDDNNVVHISNLPDRGYEVKTLTVMSGNDELEVIDNSFTLPTDGIANIAVSFEPINYTFTSGIDAIYQGEDLVFKVDGDYSLFDKVYINDEELDKNNYTSKEGSTIITLLKKYLETLEIGTYNIKITYTTGVVASSNFIIKEQENTELTNEIENPNTGDNILIYEFLIFISTLGLISSKKYLNERR